LHTTHLSITKCFTSMLDIGHFLISIYPYYQTMLHVLGIFWHREHLHIHIFRSDWTHPWFSPQFLRVKFYYVWIQFPLEREEKYMYNYIYITFSISIQMYVYTCIYKGLYTYLCILYTYSHQSSWYMDFSESQHPLIMCFHL
jgi:hypothetical protein